MASLWTPEGEHRVNPEQNPEPSSDAVDQASTSSEGVGALSNEEAEEALANLEQELLSAPVEAIIANHCYGMFQLAVLHMGQQPPHLDDAQLAIDAFAAVVENLGDRLGPSTSMLRDALAQIRLAYVQIASVQPGQGGEPTNGVSAN